MSTVSATRRTKFTAVVRGDDMAVADGLIASRVAFRYSVADRGYLVPLSVLDRLLVEIERAGHRVDWVAPLW